MGVGLAAVFNPADYAMEVVPCNQCGSTETAPVADRDRYGFSASIVECAHCHLVYTSPRMTKEGFAALYQDGYRPLVQAFSASLHHDVAVPSAPSTTYPEALHYFAQPYLPASGRLLDVGGSIGDVSGHFAKQYGYAVTIIDPCPSELSQADGHRICGGVEDVDFPTASFEVILCCRTIDHLLDPKGALEKMGQWLAPGGVLFVDIMNVPAWHEPYRYKVDHPYAFSTKTALAMLRSTGWTIKRFWRTHQDRYVGFLCQR